jgi:hypothetical protein
MSDIVHSQTALHHVTRRRTPLHRAVASRTAMLAVITGFAVMSTSAAAAVGVLPQPMQSALDRAARIAHWQTSDREGPAAVSDDPEPTTITEATVPDAIVPTTVAAYVAVDREMDAQALCGRWATSRRSGVELEPDAKRALVAIAARAGADLERLCGPAASTPIKAVPTAQESQPPEAVLPTVSTVDTNVPTTDAPPASTNEGTPKETPTLPPQAHGNGPPVTEPSPADKGNDAGGTGTPDPNANANATGNANSHGGNPNANPNAGGANGNGNGNGAGVNGNANGGSRSSNGGGDDGSG